MWKLKTEDKSITVKYDEEERDKLYKYFDNNKRLLDNNMSLILYKAREQQKIKEKYLDILAIDEELNEELKLTKQAIVLLKGWYSKSKEMSINKLQERINSVLGNFFHGDYKLKLAQSVERGSNVVNLIATGSDGKEVGTMEVVLSGAEQQLSGFLVQIAATGGNNTGIMVLDEAFSSFGMKEVAMLPEILNSMDKQMIVIEHKHELFDDFPVHTIHLDRDDQKGTYVREITNME